MNIATEGWVFRNPEIDYSTWEKPEAAAQAALWLPPATPPIAGRWSPSAEVRQAMAAG